MAIDWKSISANFGDANSAFRAGQEGLSNAGTVFGQLRKSILDEEQRAVENAFKEKQLAEQIRQFGLGHELDRDKLAETIRSNQAGEQHQQATLAETSRHNKATEGISRAKLELLAAEDRQKQQTQANYAKIFTEHEKQDAKVMQEYNDLQNKINGYSAGLTNFIKEAHSSDVALRDLYRDMQNPNINAQTAVKLNEAYTARLQQLGATYAQRMGGTKTELENQAALRAEYLKTMPTTDIGKHERTIGTMAGEGDGSLLLNYNTEKLKRALNIAGATNNRNNSRSSKKDAAYDQVNSSEFKVNPTVSNAILKNFKNMDWVDKTDRSNLMKAAHLIASRHPNWSAEAISAGLQEFVAKGASEVGIIDWFRSKSQFDDGDEFIQSIEDYIAAGYTK